jgi:prepilin-type processing-associated H-X9-DG protein
MKRSKYGGEVEHACSGLSPLIVGQVDMGDPLGCGQNRRAEIVFLDGHVKRVCEHFNTGASDSFRDCYSVAYGVDQVRLISI